ncbi:unnamed protein product [Ilex paraguariensis]|uniref:Uncharacterized protein n=1 Tax=Ilex paraguariensis TaxID=185542 RepID=A0ABC8T5Y0_9AQUA
MGTANAESDQTSPGTESEHKITTNGNLRISFPSKLSSSFSSFSSSPESTLEDPFQEDDEQDMSISTTATPKLDKDAQLAFDYGERDAYGSSITKHEQANYDLAASALPVAATSHTPKASSDTKSTTECPPTQVMEHPSNSSLYRIPSSVFARTKSTSPVEWSVASNESLFSIHMGNMSFTKDHFFWRSGELGTPGEASTSGSLFNFPTNQSLVGKSTNSGKSCEIGVAEEAVETMKEVLMESSEDQNNKRFLTEGRISRRSEESSTSTKSFAFPILATDVASGNSMKGNSVRIGPQKQPPLSQQLSKSLLQPQLHPSAQPEPKTPAATPEVVQTRWFSCWPCWLCSSCCS